MNKIYKNTDEVLDNICQEWFNIPLEMINNLIDAHQVRVLEVYELGGALQ